MEELVISTKATKRRLLPKIPSTPCLSEVQSISQSTAVFLEVLSIPLHGLLKKYFGITYKYPQPKHAGR